MNNRTAEFCPEIGRTQYWMRVAAHLEKLTGNRYGLSYIREISDGIRTSKRLNAHIESAVRKTDAELDAAGVRVREI